MLWYDHRVYKKVTGASIPIIILSYKCLSLRVYGFLYTMVPTWRSSRTEGCPDDLSEYL